MSQNVNVDTNLTLIATQRVFGADVVSLHIKNNGPSALNAFQLKGRAGNGDEFGHVLLQSAGFTTPGVHCIYASGEPGSLASGAECILYLTPGYLQDISLWASVASGSAGIVVDMNRGSE